MDSLKVGVSIGLGGLSDGDVRGVMVLVSKVKEVSESVITALECASGGSSSENEVSHTYKVKVK